MSRVATNSFWLLIAQVGGLIIPLVELPILARALGQQAYGQVLYVLGMAMMAAVFIEFGFSFSAARSVAKAEGNHATLAQIVADVVLAKLLLSSAVILIVGVIVFSGAGVTVIPHYWLLWITLSILAFGFSPMWYYIGIEQLRTPAILDLGLRTIGLLLVVLLISSPDHAQRVLAIQALIGFANTIIPTIIMLRRTGVGRMHLAGAWRAIRDSAELFLYKGAQSMMGSLASTLLGFLSGARAVGTFVPAEKLVRAASGLAAPVLHAAFPHLVRLQQACADDAKKLVGRTCAGFGIATILVAALTVYLAPWAIRIVFGPGYEDAVGILQLLIWVAPLRICSMTLAILWFIPSGQEHVASRAILMNIALVCLLTTIMAPTLGGIGMAMAFLIAESIMLTVLVFVFAKKSA